MQKFRTILLIALTATIAISLCAAPKKTSNKTQKRPKMEKVKLPKLPPANEMKQPFAYNDIITSFRYELYDVEANKPVRSEVYILTNTKSKFDNDYYTGLYYRRYGTYTENYGYNYSEPDIKPALDSLKVAIAELRLYDFARSSVDNEDRSRSRWLVEIEFLSEKIIEIVEYTDQDEKADAGFICQTLRNIFESQISRTEATRAYRMLERTEYKPDGTWQRMKRYDNEGRVCGGEDVDRPDVDY